MHVRSTHLRHHPAVFRQLTGLTVPDFDGLVADLLPACTAAAQVRLNRPTRQRARGGGGQFELPPREQILLTVIWLRQYPMHAVLGVLFGLSHPTVGRTHRAQLTLAGSGGAGYDAPPCPWQKTAASS